MINSHMMGFLALGALLTVAECGNGLEMVELFRRELLPSWFEISPAKLQSVMPFEMQAVAEGVGPVLAPKGPSCGTQFAFKGRDRGSERLDRVAFVFRGPKTALMLLAKELLMLTQLQATDDDLARLQFGDTTDFAKRVPEDPRQPGILTTLTLKLEARQEWELEFEFRQSKDPENQILRRR